MKKPTNAIMIAYVAYWPHQHVSIAFYDHPEYNKNLCVANQSKIWLTTHNFLL